MPIITALSFLANNRRRRSSGSSSSEAEPEPEPEPEKNDDDNSQGGKTLIRAKNSFEMLRQLREMRAKKREAEHEGRMAAAGASTSAAIDEDTGVYRIYVDQADSSSSPAPVSQNRRSSLDDKNVDRSVTEKYALSRKRQVLLSDDEDTNSNSSAPLPPATTSKVERNSSPTLAKPSSKKRVVLSSNESGDSGSGDDDDDDDGSQIEEEKPPFEVPVLKKPTKKELEVSV